MTTSTKSFFVYFAVAVVVVLALIVGACGGGAAPTPTTAPKPQPTPTAPTRATPTPVPATPTTAPTPAPAVKRGGVLSIPLNADYNTADPSKVQSFATIYPLRHVWSGLIRYGNKSYTDTTLVGDLADSWTISSDAKVYTFKLNPNARWQNIAPVNGRPFTAADAKWFLNLIRDPAYGSGAINRVQAISDIQTPDDHTLVITLKQPSNSFLDDIAQPVVMFLPKEVYDKEGNWESTIIGTGPFVFGRHERGVQTVTQKNPNFWRNGVDGKPAPYIDEIRTVVMTDLSTIRASVRAGQLAFYSPGGLTTPEEVGEFANVQGVTLAKTFPMYVLIWHINVTRKPFDNPLVRQAILRSIDFDAFRKNVLRQPDAPFESFITVGNQPYAYPQDKLAKLETRDVSAAKQLLAQAGYPNGFDMGILNTYPERADFANRAAIAIQNLKDVGINASLSNPPGGSTAATGLRNRSEFDTDMSGGPIEANPVAYLSYTYLPGGGYNFGKVNDPKLTQMVTDAGTILDPAKLKQAIMDIQDYMWTTVPAIPVSAGQIQLPQWNWLKNFSRQFVWGYPGIEYAWIDK